MTESEEINRCGCLRLFKKDGTEGSIYQLSLKEVCSIGSDISATIRLKSGLGKLQQTLCNVTVDTNGVATLQNKDINQPIKLNNKSLRGSRYLLPGDCFVVLGKKIRYNNPSLTAEQIQCLKSKNTKARISPKLRHSAVTTTRKSLIRSTKTNLDRSHSKRSQHNNNIDSTVIVSKEVTRTPDAWTNLGYEFGENVPKNKQLSSKMRKSQVSLWDKRSSSIGSLRHTDEKFSPDYVTLAKSTKHRSWHDLNAMPNYERVSKGLISSPGQFEQDSSNVSMTSEASQTDGESEEALEESVSSNVNSLEVSPELKKKEKRSGKENLLSFQYSNKEKSFITAYGDSSKGLEFNEQFTSPGSQSTNSNSSNLSTVSEDKAEDFGGIRIGLLTTTAITNTPDVKPIADTQTRRQPSIKRSFQYTQGRLLNCSSSAQGENTNDKKFDSTDLESSNLKNVSSDASMTSEEKYTSTDEELNLSYRMNTSHILTPNLKDNILKGKHSQSLKKSCGRSSYQYTNNENEPQYSNTVDRKNQSSRFTSEDSDDTDHWKGNEQRSGLKINKSCTLTLSTKPNISRIKSQTEVIKKRKRSVRRSLPKHLHVQSSHTFGNSLPTNILKSSNTNIEDMESDSPEIKFKLSSNLSNRLTSEDTDDLEESKHNSLFKANKSSTFTLGNKRNLAGIMPRTELMRKRKRNTRRSVPYVDINNDSYNIAKGIKLSSTFQRLNQCLFTDQSSDDTDDLYGNGRTSLSNVNISGTLPLSVEARLSRNNSRAELIRNRKESIRRCLQIPQELSVDESSVANNSQFASEDTDDSENKHIHGSQSSMNNMETEHMKNDSYNDVKLQCTLQSPTVRIVSLQHTAIHEEGANNFFGVKKLMSTSKAFRSSTSELSDLCGEEKLMSTPKHTSPKNDPSSFPGVKKLMCTPKSKSSHNDLSEFIGINKLMSTPKHISPNNDLSSFPGVKKLMSTPKVDKSSYNDLSEFFGVKELMSTPKKIINTEKENTIGKRNDFFNPENCDILESEKLSEDYQRGKKDNVFDSLRVNKPLRTYRGKSTSPLKMKSDESVQDVETYIRSDTEKWVQKHCTMSSSKNDPPINLSKSTLETPVVHETVKRISLGENIKTRLRRKKTETTLINTQPEPKLTKRRGKQIKMKSIKNLDSDASSTQINEVVTPQKHKRRKEIETALGIDTETTEANLPKRRGRPIKIKTIKNLDSDASSTQINEVVTPQKHKRGKEIETALGIDMETTEANLPKRRGRPIKIKSVKNLDSDASSTQINQVVTPRKHQRRKEIETALGIDTETTEVNLPKKRGRSIKTKSLVTRKQNKQLATIDIREEQDAVTDTVASRLNSTTNLLIETHSEIDKVEPSSHKTSNKENVAASNGLVATSKESSTEFSTSPTRLIETIEEPGKEQAVVAGITPVRKSTRKRQTSRRLSTNDYIIETKPKRKAKKSQNLSTKKQEVVECRRSKRTKK